MAQLIPEVLKKTATISCKMLLRHCLVHEQFLVLSAPCLCIPLTFPIFHVALPLASCPKHWGTPLNRKGGISKGNLLLHFSCISTMFTMQSILIDSVSVILQLTVAI